jgi:predicted phosphoadenosine phosphosulfate sulfurtransferase
MKKTIPKKVRQFIDNDVYTESLKRIEHIYNTFDTLVVLFSGGKDSLVTLHLVKEVLNKHGVNRVNVVFRDEEIIPNTVIDFVNEYRKKEWIDMNYFAVPLMSQIHILGETKNYIQWDASRQHVRKIPDHAIKSDKVYNQYKMDAYTASFYKGKIALVNGIRAAESITRYGACMSKVNENYINNTASNIGSVRLCKPIFDWQENDVFKYLHDHQIKYCTIYDRQMWNQEQLRVATPLVSENAKRFYKLKTLDPVLYEQILDIFPKANLQDRYWNQIDMNIIKNKYGKTLHTVLDYIKDYIKDPKQRNKAIKQFKKAVVMHRNDPDGYPIDHVLTYFRTGAYKRNLYVKDTWSKK